MDSRELGSMSYQCQDHEVVNQQESSTDTKLDHEQELTFRYLEQQRRLSCPACGEAEEYF